MTMTALLNSLAEDLAESQEKELSEITTENEMSSSINVEAQAGAETAVNPEPKGAVEPETDLSPEQGAREVEDDGGRIEKVEIPPAFIEAKKMLHKKKFRE